MFFFLFFYHNTIPLFCRVYGKVCLYRSYSVLGVNVSCNVGTQHKNKAVTKHTKKKCIISFQFVFFSFHISFFCYSKQFLNWWLCERNAFFCFYYSFFFSFCYFCITFFTCIQRKVVIDKTQILFLSKEY